MQIKQRAFCEQGTSIYLTSYTRLETSGKIIRDFHVLLSEQLSGSFPECLILVKVFTVRLRNETIYLPRNQLKVN